MKPPSRFLFFGINFLVLLAFYFSLTHGPFWRRGIFKERQNPKMQMLRAIGLAMYSYANDNGGNYPDGKSSTEVFQKLLDGGYATDPALFYLRLQARPSPSSGKN
jgi:hypothetical protein